MTNTYSVQCDIEEIEKLPDKECCLVCLIITVFHASFVGVILYLVQNEDNSQSY